MKNKLKQKKKKAKPAGKKKVGAESASSSSTDAQMTEEHKAFIKIFGDRKNPGDQTLANKVLLEYCENFPEAEEKSTKCRGKVQLTSYVIKTGARHAKRTVKGKRKMDYEAFCTAMEAIVVVETRADSTGWAPRGQATVFTSNMSEGLVQRYSEMLRSFE